MRVLIADDEPMALRLLERYVRADPEVTAVEACTNGAQARDSLASGDFDVALLDIRMPELDGLSAVRALDPESMPSIVFVTAYEDYALGAFELGAVHYLLKPFDESRFAEAFQRAKVRRREARLSAKGRELAALLSTEPRAGNGESSRITIECGDGLRRVDVASLRWVEAADKFVVYHTIDGELRERRALSAVEAQLDAREFLRVHRSCLVAVDRIRSLGQTEGGVHFVVLDDDSRVTVSRSRVASVRARLR